MKKKIKYIPDSSLYKYQIRIEKQSIGRDHTVFPAAATNCLLILFVFK